MILINQHEIKVQSVSFVEVPSHNKRISSASKIEKVLLIQPPAFTNNERHDMNPNPPLGIAYIAAVLEENGFDVKILDAFMEGWDCGQRISSEKLLVGMPYEEIDEYIRDFKPDLVGVTSMFTSQRKNAQRVAEIVKSINNDIPVILGGAHPTAAPESVIADRNVDFAILGEGENTIVPLIKAIERNQDFGLLNGIAYLNDDGQAVILEKTEQINDLDLIPYPARHLLPMEKYFDAGVRHGGYSRGKRAASIITSRGCQYRCNFCTAFKVFTRRPRLRSADNVIGEIKQLVDNYGIDELWFEDDQLLAKKDRTIKLLDALSERFNLIWDTPNGVSPWLLNEEIIRKMKTSGCYNVNLAIESGNQEVLDKIINKPVDLSKIPDVIALIRKYKMSFSTFLVIGNISMDRIETIDEMRQSFKYMRKLKVIPHVSLLTAYPGSEVLNVAEKKGYLVPGFNWDDLIIQKFQLQTPEWTPEELLQLVQREILFTKVYIHLLCPAKTIRKIIERLKSDPIATIGKIFKMASQAVKIIPRSLVHHH